MSLTLCSISVILLLSAAFRSICSLHSRRLWYVAHISFNLLSSVLVAHTLVNLLSSLSSTLLPTVATITHEVTRLPHICSLSRSYNRSLICSRSLMDERAK